jgi:Ni2+-binding GTPase involved in maturation of urease and hydrogenase
MTTEKPAVISPRVYKKHRKMIKQLKRKMKCSDAQVVREAIERLHRDFQFAD